MTKADLTAAVLAVKTETKNALQLIYDELNNGQRQKLLQNEDVKSIFERYGVEF